MSIGSDLEKAVLEWTTPLMAVLIVLEIVVSAWGRRSLYEVRDTANNLIFTTLNAGIDVLMRGVSLIVLGFCFSLTPARWDHQGLLYWAALFLAEDFLYYLLHCADHYVRLLWAVHVTHHSSEKFNLTVAIRSSVFQPVYRFLFYLPLAAAGFEPLHILFMYSITQVWGFWVHTDLIGKLGPLEWIFVTPSHHRVHHASNPKYLDRNMGMVLIVWDRLFGTFQAELNEEKPVYGTTTRQESENPIAQLFYEWRNIGADLARPLPFRIKLKYLFMPPGWSHDGNSHTSNDMRRQEAERDANPNGIAAPPDRQRREVAA